MLRLASTKPLARSGSIGKKHLPSSPPTATTTTPPPQLSSRDLGDRLTIAKFVARHKQDFPVRFVVTKGYYGPSEDLKFSDGDRFRAHSLKQSTVISVQYENGLRESIPANSSIPFAVLFDPHGNSKEAASKGYRFEKISELVQLPVLPPVLWSRKSYHGSSPDSSVSANELLIVKGVKSKLVGRQQLKVYSHTQKKDKTLYTSCVGSFSTKPRDVCLFLDDIVKHMPDIFPCRAVMVTAENQPPRTVQGVQLRPGPHVVTLMHSSIETYLTISSALGRPGSGSQIRHLQIPIDLGIMVRLDASPDDDDEQRSNGIYEDTSLYCMYEQPTGNGNVSNSHHQIQDSNQTQQHSNAPRDPHQGQFYTNVHFGQERSLNYVLQQPQPKAFQSCEAAIEHGHYQSPRDAVRTSSDPIDISGMPVRDEVTNYVLLSKNSEEREGRGSLGRSPPVLSSSAERANHSSSSSPSYRPPLPPPNRTKREGFSQHRSPGYTYVDANPTRSTKVYNDRSLMRSQAAGTTDSGSGLSTSVPDSASSEKSFGSSGSGSAVVDRRFGSCVRPSPGSGDGVVERSMRTSSISSAGYSYAKTNPPHPHHAHQPPTNSPHHYSHLRSRSGPPVLPQGLSVLNQQQQQQQQQQLPSQQQQLPIQQQQRPIATTCLDGDSDSIRVIQRQTSNPAMAVAGGGRPHPLQHNRPSRQESAPALHATPTHRPGSLEGVIDDLTKMTQELGMLEENIFTTDELPSPNSEVAKSPSEEPREQAPATSQELPPEIVAENKAYLKSFDNYQILRLLENMSLEQYTPTFKQEQINGDILSTCDEAILRDELKVTSRLHRIRLLRVIEGAYSVHDIMSGKDGYIFMASTGKQ